MKKKILLTGATGTMGAEAMQLLCSSHSFDVVVLVPELKTEKKKIAKYARGKNVKIVFGDLRNYLDVQKAVKGVDMVLHVGALVSPKADYQPKMAWDVNYGGTKNIVDAIVASGAADQIKLVYIGSVAQIGNRTKPFHWGRVGDPLVPSSFDYYALSKIAAERYVIESGLKHWVSLRQTGILHPGLLDVNNGIGYHMPLNNHMEWVSARDSGRILLNIASKSLPEAFWKKVYNIGGGASCRLTAFEFIIKAYGLLKVDIRKLESPAWYATRNFHGHWFLDSDRLNNILDFRRETVEDVMTEIKEKLSLGRRLLHFLPLKTIRNVMLKKAQSGDTPLGWMHRNEQAKINAFLGSATKWRALPDWQQAYDHQGFPPRKLQHGYNEAKPLQNLDLSDMKQVAAFRGGECLSTSMNAGNLTHKLEWVCAHGHRFRASPYLILKAGHWCEMCLKPPWNFDDQAKHNPFLAQVWYSDHEKNENQIYG